MIEAAPSDLSAVLNEAAGSATPLTTAQRTAQTLRTAILSGRVARGARVGESQISTALRVSRNTAREALRLLQAEGLVSHEPYRSPVVTVLAPEDVADVFAVRSVLELAATDMIAARSTVSDLQPLRRAVESLSRLVGADHGLAVIEADREFHAGLVALAGSPRLLAAYERIEGEIRLCLSISTRTHQRAEELVDQHARFLELLEARRFDEFKADLKTHMDLAVDRVTHVLTQSKDAADKATAPEVSPGANTPSPSGSLSPWPLPEASAKSSRGNR